jgi:hypothetical protein
MMIKLSDTISIAWFYGKTGSLPWLNPISKLIKKKQDTNLLLTFTHNKLSFSYNNVVILIFCGLHIGKPLHAN